MMTMPGTEPVSAETIPVFAIERLGGVQRAAHPDYKGTVSHEGGEILHRIGGAWRQQDGSYLIQLVAFPVDGRLLLRPLPGAECQPPTP